MSGNTIVTRPLVSQAFAPMCDICESSRGLWDSDGNRLNYCGECGARIDWGFVVDADADNEVRAPRDGELDPPDEPAGTPRSAAAIRMALSGLLAHLDLMYADASPHALGDHFLPGLMDAAHVALDAPRRNCDRFENTAQALGAYPAGPPIGEEWGDGDWMAFVDWLFAKKERGRK